MEWQHPNQKKRSAPVPSHQSPEAEKPKQNIPEKIAQVQLAAFEDETPAKMIYLPSYFIDNWDAAIGFGWGIGHP